MPTARGLFWTGLTLTMIPGYAWILTGIDAVYMVPGFLIMTLAGIALAR